jgi:2-keto-4-pentenoate hydratase/2-oxohepta-3-ene-1,7-dioic acid hydratase in catechol pathway
MKGTTAMRFARIEKDGQPLYALVEGEDLQPISGTPFSTWKTDGPRIALSESKLLVPVVPQNFYAIGLNYPEHVLKMARARGQEPKLPSRPEPGYRSNNALIAHGESIQLPPDATETQYEGELVVVMGKQAKHVSEADALSHVLGYTIGNDVSERKWQLADRSFWRSKNSDTFKPMGPWIETDVELDSLETIVRINGQVDVEFATNSMVFGVAQFISSISQYCTLFPGDVIWMGTEGQGSDLHHGDLVEVEISSIGILSNPVRQLPALAAE